MTEEEGLASAGAFAVLPCAHDHNLLHARSQEAAFAVAAPASQCVGRPEPGRQAKPRWFVPAVQIVGGGHYSPSRGRPPVGKPNSRGNKR